MSAQGRATSQAETSAVGCGSTSATRGETSPPYTIRPGTPFPPGAPAGAEGGEAGPVIHFRGRANDIFYHLDAADEAIALIRGHHAKWLLKQAEAS